VTQEKVGAIEVDTTQIRDVRNAWTEYVRHREVEAPSGETVLATIITYLPESAGTHSKNGCIYTTRLSLVPDSFLALLTEKSIPYRVCS
jgi:hypothetical protein